MRDPCTHTSHAPSGGHHPLHLPFDATTLTLTLALTLFNPLTIALTLSNSLTPTLTLTLTLTHSLSVSLTPTHLLALTPTRLPSETTTRSRNTRPAGTHATPPSTHPPRQDSWGAALMHQGYLAHKKQPPPAHPSTHSLGGNSSEPSSGPSRPLCAVAHLQGNLAHKNTPPFRTLP